MNLNNVSDEQLALIAAGVVAAIRKQFTKINGFTYVALTTFVVVFVMCAVVIAGQGNGSVSVATVIQGLVRSIWITIQSIAGVSMVSYFAGKVNSNNGGKDVTPSQADK
jgi:hypothetical protein